MNSLFDAQVDMKMPDKYMIQTVAEDVVYLQQSWNDAVDDATLRRESVVLRRLLVEEDLQRAWRACGLTGAIHIIAPRLDFFLELPDRNKIEYAIAGGGLYQGLRVALAVDNVGEKRIDLPPGINAVEHKFKLKDFLASTSVFVEQIRISRQVVIQYVANKLGGAHMDFSRKDKLAPRHKILDRNLHRFALQTQGQTPIKDKDAVYFELMSIGQLVATSDDVGRFLTKAQEMLGK